MRRIEGPVPERTARKAILPLPNGGYMHKHKVDERFWHMMLGEFFDSPLRMAGDYVLAQNDNERNS